MTQAATVRTSRVLAVAAATMLSLPLVPAGPAAGGPVGCPDVEVVFARGIAEPPGVGWIGQQFVDALRWRVGPRSLAVYPVNYPADPDFATTVDGVIDTHNHVRDTAATCPDTEIVLGGYSRGAAVVGYTTAAAPAGYTAPYDMMAPLPAGLAGHVAAVVLLGKPSNELLSSRAVPPIAIGPGFAGKTVDLCAPGDPVCSAGGDDAAHGAYAANGMAAQAADFTAEHLRPPEIAPDQPL